MGGQGEFNDFCFVCIISPTQINFSVYNELALGGQGGQGDKGLFTNKCLTFSDRKSEPNPIIQ